MIDQFRGDYAFLSNFHPSAVVHDGMQFATVEHAYQAAKATNLGDRYKIQQCKTPGQAKRMGATIPVREDWRTINFGVMKELLRQKFLNPELRTKLLETSGHELVEGNNWGDVFWGKVEGVGANHLGRLLMEVRKEIA